MTETITTSRTFAALARQNTGRALFDSGDIYGRHWQKPPVDESAPIARLGAYGPTIETALLLDYWYEVDDRIQDAFERFAAKPENERKGWLELVEEFAESRGWHTKVAGGNTYNGESDLSQVFQWSAYSVSGERLDDWYYSNPDEIVFAIQTHNGCDVRGGYSSPLFVRPREDMEYSIPASVCASLYVVEAHGPDGEEVEPLEVPEHDIGRWTTSYTSAPWYDFENDCRIFWHTLNRDENTVCALTPDGYRVKVRVEVEGVWR